jgi:hypothetical protein
MMNTAEVEEPGGQPRTPCECGRGCGRTVGPFSQFGYHKRCLDMMWRRNRHRAYLLWELNGGHKLHLLALARHAADLHVASPGQVIVKRMLVNLLHAIAEGRLYLLESSRSRPVLDKDKERKIRNLKRGGRTAAIGG